MFATRPTLGRLGRARGGGLVRLLALVIVGVLVSAGCGPDDQTVGGPDSTTTLFTMTRDEVSAASEPAIQNAETVSKALDAHDGDLLRTAFGPSSYVVDPIVPSLRPGIATWFSIFRSFCTGVLLHDIYVNVDGSVFNGDCSGFYDGHVDDPPAALPVLSELWLEDGLARRLMNRLDAATLEAYPTETSDVIGFPSSQEAAVSAAAQTAVRFASTWVETWQSGELEPIAALYAPDGVRVDGFAALADDSAALMVWLESFTDSYDEVAVEIELLTASALGPAAVYRLELVDGAGSCEMQIASVWDLDEKDRILRESVYYHPESTFACGWEQTDR